MKPQKIVINNLCTKQKNSYKNLQLTYVPITDGSRYHSQPFMKVVLFYYSKHLFTMITDLALSLTPFKKINVQIHMKNLKH